MNRILAFSVSMFLLWHTPAFAKSKSLKDQSQYVYFGGTFQFTDSAADDVAGASYTKKMTNPVVLVGGLGFRLFNFLFLGARYEHWIAGRGFTVGGVAQNDTLKYQSIGGELGIYRGNPRFFWIVSAGWFHPITLSVESTRGSTSSTYIHEPKPVGYQARLTMGVKLNSLMSFRLEGGYRHANFGDMSSGSTSLLQGGEKLDLSGPFVGVGLGVHF